MLFGRVFYWSEFKNPHISEDAPRILELGPVNFLLIGQKITITLAVGTSIRIKIILFSLQT